MSGQPTISQFPKSRRKIRGSYDALEPSPRGKFNGRDAASVGAFVATAQPVIFATSYQLEGLASSMMPGAPTSFAFGFLWAWFLQTIGAAVIKGLANLMRHYGMSIAKDILAWLWIQISDALPFARWRRRRRERRLPVPRPRFPDGVRRPRRRRPILPWRR